jgi:hypothetical protein
MDAIGQQSIRMQLWWQRRKICVNIIWAFPRTSRSIYSREIRQTQFETIDTLHDWVIIFLAKYEFGSQVYLQF